MPRLSRLYRWMMGGTVLSGCLLVAMLSTGASSRPPHQPIDFMHRVHAGDRQIACAYCHRTAETADDAGMPSVELCMSCHRSVIPDSAEIWKLRSYWEMQQPIPWIRVNQLPAHVFFSHKAHVVNGKIGCESCHGSVSTTDALQQTVPLTMGWCLDCHRKRQANTECWACHR